MKKYSINKKVAGIYGLVASAFLTATGTYVANEIEHKNNLAAVWQEINTLSPTVLVQAKMADDEYYQRWLSLVKDPQTARLLAMDVSKESRIQSRLERAKSDPDNVKFVCSAMLSLCQIADDDTARKTPPAETTLCLSK